MNYETANRRKKACITGFLILVMWGWSGLQSHIKNLQSNPETGLLVFGCAFGIPILLLLILSIYYSVKAKQLEFDEFDKELDDVQAQSDENNNDENQKAP